MFFLNIYYTSITCDGRKSNEEQAKCSEQRAKSNKLRAKNNKQGAKVTSNEYKVTSNKLKVTNNEQKVQPQSNSIKYKKPFKFISKSFNSLKGNIFSVLKCGRKIFTDSCKKCSDR